MKNYILFLSICGLLFANDSFAMNPEEEDSKKNLSQNRNAWRSDWEYIFFEDEKSEVSEDLNEKIKNVTTLDFKELFKKILMHSTENGEAIIYGDNFNILQVSKLKETLINLAENKDITIFFKKIDSSISSSLPDFEINKDIKEETYLELLFDMNLGNFAEAVIAKMKEKQIKIPKMYKILHKIQKGETPNISNENNFPEHFYRLAYRIANNSVNINMVEHLYKKSGIKERKALLKKSHADVFSHEMNYVHEPYWSGNANNLHNYGKRMINKMRPYFVDRESISTYEKIGFYEKQVGKIVKHIQELNMSNAQKNTLRQSFAIVVGDPDLLLEDLGKVLLEYGIAMKLKDLSEPLKEIESEFRKLRFDLTYPLVFHESLEIKKRFKIRTNEKEVRVIETIFGNIFPNLHLKSIFLKEDITTLSVPRLFIIPKSKTITFTFKMIPALNPYVNKTINIGNSGNNCVQVLSTDFDVYQEYIKGEPNENKCFMRWGHRDVNSAQSIKRGLNITLIDTKEKKNFFVPFLSALPREEFWNLPKSHNHIKSVEECRKWQKTSQEVVYDAKSLHFSPGVAFISISFDL